MISYIVREVRKLAGKFHKLGKIEYSTVSFRLKFVEKELSQLESAKEEAEQFLKQRDIVILCKYKLFNKYLYDLEREKGGVNENMNELKTQIANVEGQLEEVIPRSSALYTLVSNLI